METRVSVSGGFYFPQLASGISEAKNLLMSEDVLASINVIKKLGIKVIRRNNSCKILWKRYRWI